MRAKLSLAHCYCLGHVIMQHNFVVWHLMMNFRLQLPWAWRHKDQCPFVVGDEAPPWRHQHGDRDKNPWWRKTPPRGLKYRDHIRWIPRHQDTLDWRRRTSTAYKMGILCNYVAPIVAFIRQKWIEVFSSWSCRGEGVVCESLCDLLHYKCVIFWQPAGRDTDPWLTASQQIRIVSSSM